MRILALNVHGYHHHLADGDGAGSAADVRRLMRWIAGTDADVVVLLDDHRPTEPDGLTTTTWLPTGYDRGFYRCVCSFAVILRIEAAPPP